MMEKKVRPRKGNYKCNKCGQIFFYKILTTKNGISLCNHCSKQKVYHCHDCGCEIKNVNELMVASIDTKKTKLICKKCYKLLFFVCEFCQKEYKIKEYLSHNKFKKNAKICTECVQTFFLKCPGCHCFCNKENLVAHQEATLIVNKNQKTKVLYICGDCLSEKYVVCKNCGHISPIETYKEILFNNKKYCGVCFKRIFIHDYGYFPSLIFRQSLWETRSKYKLCDRGPLFLGMELEVEGDVATILDIFLKMFNNSEKEIFFTKDSSLKYGGLELKTHPVTLSQLGEIHLRELFQEYQKAGIKGEDSTDGCCGLHVHVSRKFLIPREWSKIDWFFWKCQEQIIKFSRRKSRPMIDKYCFFERPLNYKHDSDTTKPSCNFLIYTERAGEHHRALSFYPPIGTVEFRIFNSTIDYNVFVSAAQFVDCLINMAIQISTATFFNKYSYELWSLFCNFANENIGEYKLLVNELNNRKIFKIEKEQ